MGVPKEAGAAQRRRDGMPTLRKYHSSAASLAASIAGSSAGSIAGSSAGLEGARSMGPTAPPGPSVLRRQGSVFPALEQPPGGGGLLDAETCLQILGRLEKVPLAPKSLATSADAAADTSAEALREKPGGSIIRWALGARGGGAAAKEKPSSGRAKAGSKKAASKGAEFAVVNCISAGRARQWASQNALGMDGPSRISWAMGFLPKTWVPQGGWGSGSGAGGAPNAHDDFLQVLHVSMEALSPTKVHPVKVLGGFLASACPDEPLAGPSQEESAKTRKFTIVAAHSGDDVCQRLNSLADLAELAPGVLEEMEGWLQRMVELDAHDAESDPVVISRLTRARAVGVIKAANQCWKEERAKRRQLHGKPDAAPLVEPSVLERLGLEEGGRVPETGAVWARGRAQIAKCQTLDERPRPLGDVFGSFGVAEIELGRRPKREEPPSGKSASLPRSTTKVVDRESKEYLARRAKVMSGWKFPEQEGSKAGWGKRGRKEKARKSERGDSRGGSQASDEAPPVVTEPLVPMPGLLAPPRALVRTPESDSSCASSDASSVSGDSDQVMQHWEDATNSGEITSAATESPDDANSWGLQASTESGDSPGGQAPDPGADHEGGRVAGPKDAVESSSFRLRSLRLETVLEEQGHGGSARGYPRKGTQRPKLADSPPIGPLGKGTDLQAEPPRSSSPTFLLGDLMAERLSRLSTTGRRTGDVPLAYPSQGEGGKEACGQSQLEAGSQGMRSGFVRSASLGARSCQAGTAGAADWGLQPRGTGVRLPPGRQSSPPETSRQLVMPIPGRRNEDAHAASKRALLLPGTSRPALQPSSSSPGGSPPLYQPPHGHGGSVGIRDNGSASRGTVLVDPSCSPPGSQASSFKPSLDHRAVGVGNSSASQGFDRSQSLLSRRAAGTGPCVGAPQEHRDSGSLRLDRPLTLHRNQLRAGFMHSKSLPQAAGPVEGSLMSPRTEAIALKMPKLDLTSPRVLSQFAPSKPAACLAQCQDEVY